MMETLATDAGIARRVWDKVRAPWRTTELRLIHLTQRGYELETPVIPPTVPAKPAPVRAPNFGLPGLNGGLVHLDALLALGKPLLLFFADPSGSAGQTLMATISDWQRAHNEPLTVIGINPAADAPKSMQSVLPHGITDILSPGATGSTIGDYRVTLTPALVLVRPNGVLVGGPVVGSLGIQALLDSLAGAAAEAASKHQRRTLAGAPPIGTHAPRVLLPGYDGVDHDVVEPGSRHILLFWNPDCGYCRQLVPLLRALEAESVDGMPAITLVARGSEEANRRQGFGFRTLFDDDLSASSAFGVVGTPTAVVVESDGTVSHEPARGVRAVRELLAPVR